MQTMPVTIPQTAEMEFKKKFVDRYSALTDIDEFKKYSFYYLRKSVRVNTLKIDSLFVQKIEINGGNTEIIRSIVGLARSLGLSVIAEGVETDNQYLNFANEYIYRRPRYYMAHKDDKFKYWTSYRKENGIERGISNIPSGDSYYIDDAAPFIVYKDEVPANRVVVKMQTGVGDVNLGPFNFNGINIKFNWRPLVKNHNFPKGYGE